MTTVATSTSMGVNPPAKTNKRLQLESLIREFQGKLGPDWDTYHEAVSAFLIGRLSRGELVAQIGPLLKNGLLKFHNKLLLLNFANSLHDSAPDFSSELASFWNKRNARAKSVKSNQYEKFKQNIMGLPLKERRRIRAITKDAGKRDKVSALVTLTRQALLPKVPMIQDKEQQQLQVNNLVQWQQDVVTGIHTQLATSSYELPDADTLSRRVVLTSREHGLTGGINARVFEVISLGLESHLKTILECAIDTVRYRKRKYELHAFLPPGFLASSGPGSDSHSGPGLRRRRLVGVDEPVHKTVTLSAEDVYNTLEMFPHLVEPGGPQYRLSSVMLQNDDLRDDQKLGYEIPQSTAKTVATAPSEVAGEGDDRAAGEVAGRGDDKVDGEVDGDVAGGSGPKRDAAAEKTVDADRAKENGHVANGVKAVPAKEPSHFGTVDELKWMLHELVSSS